MDELLTDQQRADVFKRWVGENGAFILAGLVLGLGGLFAWNWWQGYQDQQAEQASVVYQSVMEAVVSQRPVRAAELEADLAAEFGASPYVDQARLALAKMHMDRNDAEAAAVYLEKVVDGTSDDSIRHIAQLRLARVRLHQQQYDAALAALGGVDENSAFATRFHDVRGDVYQAMGRDDDARREFESALNAVEPGVIDRAFVQAKLDALQLPGQPASSDAAPAAASSDAAESDAE